MKRLIAILALFASTSIASAEDWPQWLGAHRDGSTSEKIETWTTAPKTIWHVPVGAGFSTPVVAAGKVYVHALIAESEKEEVIALDAKTGAVAWRTAYPRGDYRNAVTAGPQATPSVAGKRLFTFGITGILSCFDTDSGKQIWQVNPFQKLGVSLPRYGCCCSPLVVGNRVWAAVGGKGSSVVAFDADTGEIQWQGLDEPASTSSPVLFASGGKESASLPDVVFMTTLRLVALNPIDGNVNWTFPLAFQPSGTSPTPVIAGNTIVTSTQSNGATAVRVATEEGKATAAKVWQDKDVQGYFSSGVAQGDDSLFLVANQLKPLPRADLCCLDLKTGKELWKEKGVGYFHFGTIRCSNNKLLILDDKGTVKLVEASRKGYRELCHARACGGNLVTPALANGHLFARDDKEIVCLQLSQAK
ncbi:PQQ-like beta-propeller repeat protein [soil metagenome]